MPSSVHFYYASDVLTKENIAEPMRDIRRALLEADVSWLLSFGDLVYVIGLYLSFSNIIFNNPELFLFVQVSLPVVKRFVQSVSEQAVGVGLIRGVRPDQQLVKVVGWVLGIIYQ